MSDIYLHTSIGLSTFTLFLTLAISLQFYPLFLDFLFSIYEFLPHLQGNHVLLDQQIVSIIDLVVLQALELEEKTFLVAGEL